MTTTKDGYDDFTRFALKLRAEGAVSVRSGPLEVRWNEAPETPRRAESDEQEMNSAERKELDELRVLRDRFEELVV